MTQDRSNRTETLACPRKIAKRRIQVVSAGLCVLAVCAVIRYYWGATPASAKPAEQYSERAASSANAVRRADDAPTHVASNSGRARRSSKDVERTPMADKVQGSSVPPIVAAVNAQRITNEDLARECLRRYGKEVLESMVNKMLIVQECQRRGVVVSRHEVDAEIERMSKRFNIPVDQWLKLLKQERNVSPDQYANDIIWPTLALRKLAGKRMAIGRDEIMREYETQYGEAVKCRLIAVSDLEKAKKLRAQAAAKPDDFGSLAKNYSEDAPSASVKGIINPIRKHGSYKEIEDAVFHMGDGEVSQVIHAGGQYVILKREGVIEARAIRFDQVSGKLEEFLRDRKMRGIAQEIFRDLQGKAKVENVWNDPARRAQMPGVAAVIDGTQVTIRELGEECVARHGLETLEGVINRKIIEQACKRRNITVTDGDLDKEIALAASAGVRAKPDGSPDIDAWLELVVKKQGMSVDTYRSDVVWPAAALKKLAGANIKVSEEDLRKGFDANYGPRMRCLAIVMSNARRAQEVFEMARRRNTTENFGDLASQYSVEPGSQALRGEVPPIKKHGGQPELEKEAFALRPGELSGVIQVGDKFILLRCEGYTKPIHVKFAEVRDEIHRDIYEKKLRLAMSEVFEKLQDAAIVDNFLAGTSHSPRPSAAPGVQVPSLRQVPGG